MKLIKKIPYFIPIFLVCLIAAALVSTLDSTASGLAEFILGWDANAEADLDGYEIYFRNGVPGSTYEFLTAVYVDELEDPDNPVVTITDVNNGFLSDIITPVVRMAELANNSTYHFALTAFDTQGKTSDFSEELCVEVIGSSVVECRSADVGSDSDGSAGNDADSGSDGSDSDGSAENDADSGSDGSDSDGSSENGAGGGSGGGSDGNGSAENGADSDISLENTDSGGSGGGCFIATSSFGFRETIAP